MSQVSIGASKWERPAMHRRASASEYLKRKYGISLSSSTLAKKAVTGGGPPFYKDGPYPIYPEPGLDEYAVGRLGKLRSSTSDEV
ncbi:MAG: hypothetical protein U1E60_18940 [Reyranellaceae bacterium]